MAAPTEIPLPRHPLPTLDLARRTPPSALPELMDGPCTRAQLRACLQDLAWVNRVLFGYRPILTWLSALRTTPGVSHPSSLSSLSFAPCPLPLLSPLRILDIGSGYGDTLREIARWANRRNLAVELTGLDLNPDATAIATQATTDPNIHFVTADALAYTPPQPPHLILSSLVTHHLEDPEIVRLLRWMESHAAAGWFINDLSRHPIPSHLFRWFSRALRLHPFVQHDGPVSFARAFQPDDWIAYCAAAGLAPDQVEIRGFTPGRLCVSRIKPQ